MKKKIIAIMLMAVLCLCALAGCGSSSSNNSNATNNSNKNTTTTNTSASSDTLTDATLQALQTKVATLQDLQTRVGDAYMTNDAIKADPDFENAHNQLASILELATQINKTNCTESDAVSINSNLDILIAAYQKAATALGV